MDFIPIYHKDLLDLLTKTFICPYVTKLYNMDITQITRKSSECPHSSLSIWASSNIGNTLLTCLSLPRETGKMKTTFQPPGSGSSNAPVVMSHPRKTGSVNSGHSSKRGSVIAFCYPEGLRSSRRRGSSFSICQPDRRRKSSTCTTSKWQIAGVAF